MAPPLANPPATQESDFSRLTSRHFLSQLLHLWHLASLDAPTVAVVWAFAFAQVAGVRLQPWIALLLFCGTWSVYVGDRMLDAYRAMRAGQLEPLRERHFFHWHHRHCLIPLAAASAAVSALLIAHLMPVVVRERNSVLGAVALVYFSGVHSPSRIPGWLKRAGSKEMLVGILFTAGCVAPTVSQMHLPGMGISRIWPLAICFGCFAALAWCNCRAIDRWESFHVGSDILLHSGSLTIAGATISIALLWANPGLSALVAAATASSFLLGLLNHTRFKISPVTLRALADAALLTPTVLLVVGALKA